LFILSNDGRLWNYIHGINPPPTRTAAKQIHKHACACQSLARYPADPHIALLWGLCRTTYYTMTGMTKCTNIYITYYAKTARYVAGTRLRARAVASPHQISRRGCLFCNEPPPPRKCTTLHAKNTPACVMCLSDAARARTRRQFSSPVRVANKMTHSWKNIGKCQKIIIRS